MDTDFLKRATKVTSFNLYASDFMSVKHKKEIQHLFSTYLFPRFNLNNTQNGVEINKLNKNINDLKSFEQLENFKRIHNYNIKGIGPGEVTLYFLIDNAILGGGSSAGIDIIVGSNKYEVKAIQVNQQKQAYDFKLGGTIPLSEVIFNLFKLKKELKISGSTNEISGNNIINMRKAAPKEMSEIEKEYKKITYEYYFKNHDIIFLNNSKTQKIGNIEAIKRVKENDISIERYTSNVLKPRIQL